MKARYFRTTFVAAVLLLLSFPAIAETIPADLKGARFVFDSDRDISRDKSSSVYLWEDGRTAKLFTGAIGPRWSPDGERIACVLKLPEKDGAIGILDRAGKMRSEIVPAGTAEAVEWLDIDTLIYVARETGEPGLSKTSLRRYDLKTGAERALYATQPGGEIYQLNWSRDRDGLILDVKDRFSGDAELMRRTAVLDVKNDAGLRVVYDWNAYKPAIFHDDETLIFQSDLDPAGKPIAKAGEGALAAYNIPSGKWAPVRKAYSVQNTRFSRGGGYFYTAEGEGDAVVIRLFSISDLERSIVRVSPKKGFFAKSWKDLRPDLFIPSEAAAIVVVPVVIPVAVPGATVAPEAVVQQPAVPQVAAEPAAAVRERVAIPRGAERIARPELPERLPQRLPERLPARAPERLPWRPDPNRQALADRIPIEQPAELPQLESSVHEPISATQKIASEKTYDPVMKATDARQEVYLKETTPSAGKTTAAKPYDPITKTGNAPEYSAKDSILRSEKMPATAKTYEPIPPAQDTIMKESAAGKTTAAKPYDPITKTPDTGDGLLATGGSKTPPASAEPVAELTPEPVDQTVNRIPTAGQKYTSGVGQPLQIIQTGAAKAPPAWFRVPPDCTPIERGWYYETEAGDRFTTQYNEDYTEYTYTEEGPNFNSKTTYPVGGGTKQQ